MPRTTTRRRGTLEYTQSINLDPRIFRPRDELQAFDLNTYSPQQPQPGAWKCGSCNTQQGGKAKCANGAVGDLPRLLCATCCRTLHASCKRCLIHFRKRYLRPCGSCEQCCSGFHTVCRNRECSVHSSVLCAACKRCRRCCTGSRNGTCSQRNPRKMRGYFECTPQMGVMLQQRGPVFHRATRDQFKVNKLHRFLAAEIELANISGRMGSPTNVVCSQWGIAAVHDGSLPSDTGVEFNTAPAQGDLFIRQIAQLCEVLDLQRAEVNQQCGLHVHASGEDFTWYDLRRMAFVWSKVEPVLQRMVPADRSRPQGYSRPCGGLLVNGLNELTAPQLSKAQLIQNIFDNRMQAKFKTNKYHDHRYGALNLASWVFRRTFECRLAPGTVNPWDIVNWSLLFGNLVQWAYVNSEAAILAAKPKDILAQCVLNKEWLEQKLAAHGAWDNTGLWEEWDAMRKAVGVNSSSLPRCPSCHSTIGHSDRCAEFRSYRNNGELVGNFCGDCGRTPCRCGMYHCTGCSLWVEADDAWCSNAELCLNCCSCHDSDDEDDDDEGPEAEYDEANED